MFLYLFRLACRLLLTVVLITGHVVAGLTKAFWYAAHRRRRRIIAALGQATEGIANALNQFIDQCRNGGSLTSQRVGQSTFNKIYWYPLLGLFMFLIVSVTATATGGRASSGPFGHPLPAALAWAFFIWLLLGRPVAYLLVPLFISTVSCPGCDEDIDAVGIWRCRCGFHPHRERHILAGRCPKCGKATEHVNCPRCQCTILLW